jgi:hypothetical protein
MTDPAPLLPALPDRFDGFRLEIDLFGGPGGMCGNAFRLLWGQWSTADGMRPGPGHRGAGRLCSPETLKPVHHFPAPGPLATEGGGVDGR